ncbi:hypothetical protein JCM14076_19020 [Methylosoma difficile]
MPNNNQALIIALMALALASKAGACEEVDLFHQLERSANLADVAFGSDTFDEAGEILGFKYSRPLDLYVGPDEWEEWEKQPFAHMKYARNH